jgi:hypothetical protein
MYQQTPGLASAAMAVATSMALAVAPSIVHRSMLYLSHIFRDIDVFSAFPLVAPLGATVGKALKTSISRKI